MLRRECLQRGFQSEKRLFADRGEIRSNARHCPTVLRKVLFKTDDGDIVGHGLARTRHIVDKSFGCVLGGADNGGKIFIVRNKIFCGVLARTVRRVAKISQIVAVGNRVLDRKSVV